MNMEKEIDIRKMEGYGDFIKIIYEKITEIDNEQEKENSYKFMNGFFEHLEKKNGILID